MVSNQEDELSFAEEGGDDELMFAAEDGIDHRSRILNPKRPWRVAIIDDAPEVHTVTKMVLGDVVFRGRGIEFHDAYSAEEGKKLLHELDDVAVLFLDVVMEHESAGLELARYIREEMGNKNVRIILRTGQPGQAPETEVIVNYDINDYKHKAELSSDKLFTTLIAALRSYQDLVTIELSRAGLENILEGSSHLLQLHSTEKFLSGVLTQMNAIFQFGNDALLCVRKREKRISLHEAVMAASGKYYTLISHPLSDLADAGAYDSIMRAFDSRHSVFQPQQYSIYFYAHDVYEIVIYIEYGRELNNLDMTLIDVFCTTAAVGLDNVHLLETLEQKVRDRTDALQRANQEMEEKNKQLEALNESLRIMAITDPLTGVFNRRHFYELADNLFRAARRYNRNFSLILLDLDHFKRINDTYGHGAGDHVLKLFAVTCAKAMREADVFGRYGGEEFVVAMPETDDVGAKTMAERIAERLRKVEFHLPGTGTDITVTVSMGVAHFMPGDQSLETIINRADIALYEAKHGGRNRIVTN